MLKRLLLACIGMLAVPFGQAADGTFNQTTAGNYTWDTNSNWVGNIIASGNGSTANLTSGTTGTINVSLTTDRTIGNINATTHAWVISGPGTLILAGSSTPTITGPSQSLNISTTINGTQGMTINGSVTLSGNNIYTGITTSNGTLTLTNSGALGATGAGNTTTVINSSQIIVMNTTITGETATINGGGSGSTSGALQGRGNSTWAGDLILGNSSTRIGTFDVSSQLTVSGNISGSQKLFISGLGTTILSGSANSYTGDTQIYRGTLKMDSGNNRLPTGTTLQLGGTSDNSVYNLNGWNQQIAGLENITTGSSNRTVTNLSGTASTLTLNGTTARSFLGDTDDTTVITGNLSLIKEGNFTQTLAKTNSYTGNTTINSGTLSLSDNATMTFYIGANHINNGISGSGSITLEGDFIFDLTGASLVTNNSWNIINVGSLGETFGGNFTVQGFSNNSGIWTSGNLSFSQATGILSVVPEPSTALLLVGGASGLWLMRRRRLA